jgi:Ca2+-binding EF-hand superfamily protein
MQRQMIGLLQKFDRWDENGDGELDQTELTRGIESLRGKPQQVDYSARDVIAFYDTDHNGRISMMEAQAGYARASEAEKRLKH